MAVKRFYDGESRRLLRYVWPYRFRMMAGIVALAIVGLSEGLIALMFQPMTDTVLTRAPSGANMTLLKNVPIFHRALLLNSFFPHWINQVWTMFAIALLVLFFGRALADYFGVVTLGYVGLAGVTDLRNDIYAKLIRQPVGFFQQHPAGRLLSAIINDTERVRTTLSDTVAGFFQYLFTLFFLVAVLLLLSWKMTIGAMIFVPVVVWPVATFGRRIRRAVGRVQTGFGEMTQIVQETISGNRVVKAFGMEGFEIAKFREAARRLFRENMDWIRNVARTSPVMDILAAITVCLKLRAARLPPARFLRSATPCSKPTSRLRASATYTSICRKLTAPPAKCLHSLICKRNRLTYPTRKCCHRFPAMWYSRTSISAMKAIARQFCAASI
jgi:subfamily B ATP-binding cassette protein MsbA